MKTSLKQLQTESVRWFLFAAAAAAAAAATTTTTTTISTTKMIMIIILIITVKMDRIYFFVFSCANNTY